MITINRHEAVILLQRAVLKHGAGHELAKGAPARYFHGEHPLCMIGVALSLIGLRAEMLQPYANGARADGTLFARALAKNGIHLTEGAVRVFRAAQSAQDDGAPWGEALAEASAA